jgi:hypothetical protein
MTSSVGAQLIIGSCGTAVVDGSVGGDSVVTAASPVVCGGVICVVGGISGGSAGATVAATDDAIPAATSMDPSDAHAASSTTSVDTNVNRPRCVLSSTCND